MKKMNHYKSSLLKIFSFGLIFVIFVMVQNKSTAAQSFSGPSNSYPASLPSNPSDPNEVAQYFQNYDTNISSACDASTPMDPGLRTWISPAGQPSIDASRQPYVLNSLNYDLNQTLMWCHYSYNHPSETLSNYNNPPTYQQPVMNGMPLNPYLLNGAPVNAQLNNNDLNQIITNIIPTSNTVTYTKISGGGVLYGSVNYESVNGVAKPLTLANNNQRYWSTSLPFSLTILKALSPNSEYIASFNISTRSISEWGVNYFCYDKTKQIQISISNSSEVNECNISTKPLSILITTPPSSWALLPTSKVVSSVGTNCTTTIVAPGCKVTFEHYVKNSGPNDMSQSFNSTAAWTSNSTGQSPIGGQPAINAALANGATATVNTNTFIVPSFAHNGDLYCQDVSVSPSSSTSTASVTSAPACVTVQSKAVTGCTGGSSGCAGQCPCENCHDPYLSTNNKLTISLPNGPYSNSSWQSSAPSTAIGAANGSSIYLYAHPTGKFEINSSQDQYGSSQNRYPSDPNTSATKVPVASTLTPNTFQPAPTGLAASNSYILNLSALVNSYPYDNHDITITYYSQYKVSTYVSQQDGYYSCNGSIQTSPTCSVTYTYNGTLSPCTSYNSDGSCANPQTCTPSNALPPSCTYTRTETYSGIPQYSWVLSSNSNDLSALGTYGPQQDSALNFPEVCPRNFKVQGPAYTRVTNVTLSPASSDQPTSVTVSTLTSVKFNVPRSPACETNNGTCSTCYNPAGVCLRHPYSVNLTYTGYYYIVPASKNSSIQPVGGTPFTINQFNVSYPAGKTSIDTLMASYDTTSVVPQYKSQLHTFTINPPATAQLNVGDQVCARFTLSYNQGGGNVNEYGGIWNGEVTNGTVYSGSSNSPVLLTVNNSTNNYYCSQPITDSPYTRLFGNDVLSGMTFSGSSISCNQSNSGLIGGNGETGPQATGTGSQFAALSLGQISNFTSAFLRTAIPTSTSGLTFANNNNSAGTYGGNFNIFGNCPTIFNYYEQKPQNATVEPTSYSIGNNTKQLVNDVLINTTGPNSPYILTVNGQINKTHVIYVNGNVYIGSTNRTDNNNSKVDYSSHVNYTRGNINSGNIPGLYVIALGNIYIGPNVSVLDGNYIAENRCDIPQNNCAPGSQFNPNNGGLINTCADINSIGNPSNPSAAFPQATLYPSCSNQLIIKGSLIAHDIKLERTYGSIRNSIKGENPLSNSPININSNSCTIGNVYNSPLAKTNYNTCAAEVFDFNPINYLSQPDFGTSQQTKYDSILSLPPVL